MPFPGTNWNVHLLHSGKRIHKKHMKLKSFCIHPAGCLGVKKIKLQERG